MFNIFIQLGLFGTSITAVFLSQRKNPDVRKWASIAGLISEPFWIYASRDQWGMLAVACIYTLIWAESFYRVWIKKDV